MKVPSLLLLWPSLALIATVAVAQTNGKPPSQMTTLDGKTYYGVAPQAEGVYPDGIVVQYQPQEHGQAVTGATGTAKIEFRNLPDDVRNMYSYDAKRAEEFAAQQAQANQEWLQTQAAEERAIMRYRDFAEMNRSLAGDADVSYSVTLDPSGKISAQGYNRTTPAETITNVNIPTFTYFARRNGLVTDYVPLETAPGTVVITR